MKNKISNDEFLKNAYKRVIDDICESKVPDDEVEFFEKRDLYNHKDNKWNIEKLKTLTCFELGAVLIRLDVKRRRR